MMEELDSDTRWLVVDGSSISIWKDNWILDGARADIFPHGDRIAQNLSVKVPDLIYNGEWVIPNQMLSFFGTSDFPVIMSSEGKRFWRGSLFLENFQLLLLTKELERSNYSNSLGFKSGNLVHIQLLQVMSGR